MVLDMTQKQETGRPGAGGYHGQVKGMVFLTEVKIKLG